MKGHRYTLAQWTYEGWKPVVSFVATRKADRNAIAEALITALWPLHIHGFGGHQLFMAHEFE